MSVVGGGIPSLYCIGQPCYGVTIFVAARVDLPPIHQSVPGAGCLRGAARTGLLQSGAALYESTLATTSAYLLTLAVSAVY